MAAVEVPQTLEYRGGQLNAAPILEVENFTNWKNTFMCHIIDEEEVSLNGNEMVEMKVLMALAEENDIVSKKVPEMKRILGVDQLIEDPSSSGKKDLVFVKSSADDTKVTIPGVERPWLSEAEGFILPNHDTDYDSADESSVCSTPLPPLKKLDGSEPISGPKRLKSILKSKSTFKAEALKGVIINEPSSAPAKGNKSSSASKVHSAPADKLKCVKIKDDPPLASVMKELNSLKLQVSKNQSSYSRTSQKSGLCGSYDHDTNSHNRIISLEREINLRNPQHAFKRYEAYGSSNHTTTDHYDIEWFRRGEALQVKKAEALKSTRAKSSKANRSKTPTKRVTCTNMWNNQDLKWCLEMTLHEQLKVMALSNVMFDVKRGTNFNSDMKIVMISSRVRDVYVLDMTSSAQESCFFAKASENLNWLWHKILSHLNFKTINKLAKQNLVIGLPSLVYSKDKQCSSCEKGKHHRASFKTKQTSSIKKCLHLLHMDL
ncbi:retrovirus-related pol polyprotein from transposon TNT 1-94 [Tanacetum coccineum]